MATTKKRTASKPRGRTATAKGGSAKRAKRKSKKENPIIIEAISIAVIAFCVFLILSIFGGGVAGTAGVFFGGVFKGLFGFGAYILPFMVVVLCIYILFQGGKKFSTSKLVYGISLFVVSITFVHVLFVNPNAQYDSIFRYISDNYANGGISNGGLLGAVVGNFCLQVFGRVGTYIIIFTVGLVLVVISTGRSFFDTILEGYYTIREKLSTDEYEDDDEDDEEYEDEDDEEYEYEKKHVVKYEEKRESKINNVVKSHPAKNGKVYTYEIKDTDRSIEKKKVLLINEEIDLRKKEKEFDTSNHLISFESDLKKKESGIQQIPEVKAEPVIKLPLIDRDSDLYYPVRSKTEEEKPPVIIIPEVNEVEQEIQPEEVILEDDNQEEIFFNSEPVYMEEIEPEIISQDDLAKALPYEYEFPPLDFLDKNLNNTTNSGSRAQILENSKKLEDTLRSFGVEAKVIEVSVGPTVTRYELSPGQGVKVSKISGLSDDLALNLAASGIRIEAPIPGKAAVGIEVPNAETQMVYLREIIESETFVKFPSRLAFALGKDIGGNAVVADIGKMPHMLIAGSTGSGKSVCINTLITSIIYKSRPEEVKLLMIDPKVVELSVYNGIPHLLIPVVNDPKKAAGALNWAVREMTLRYDLFAQTSVRDLKGYNAYKLEQGEQDLVPQIVIIIDELADLMMTAGKEVEEAICRLAQMARAAGIHLIIATQRPSVDVITGLIKANIPSRIAFAVSSGTDSRTILDSTGAERLLGKGDMLFYPMGMSKPLRVQGGFISDKEVERIVKFIKRDGPQQYDQSMVDKITAPVGKGGDDAETGEEDEFMEPAIAFVVKKEKASASMLQRQFRIGYNRASRLIDVLEERGIVGSEDGSKPRRVLMTRMEWEGYYERRNEL